MLSNEQVETLRHELFSERDHLVYAVIDGAAVRALRFKLYQWQPEYCCLWSGPLEPDMAEVAPYLVRLEEEAEFTRWLLTQGGDQHWNIFITRTEAFKAVRRHLRKFLLVKDPAGETVLFRYYDPRVIHHFKAVADTHQTERFIGKGRVLYPHPDQSGTLATWSRLASDIEPVVG